MAENKKFLDKDGLTYFYDKIKGEYVKSSDLATVATSGSYNDLNDKPIIPTNVINNLVDGTATGSLRSVNAYDDETNGLLGNNAVALGYQTAATGMCSHTEGVQTKASGQFSHAEGAGTTASGQYAHAEGTGTIASGLGSHAEGMGCTASGQGSHAEGTGCTASGNYAYAGGSGSKAEGENSFASGGGCTALGYADHAEGYTTIAGLKGYYVQDVGGPDKTDYYWYQLESIEGLVVGMSCYELIISSTDSQWAMRKLGKITEINTEDLIITTDGDTTGKPGGWLWFSDNPALGTSIIDGAKSAHAEGYNTKAFGYGSHAEGYGTIAVYTQDSSSVPYHQHVEGRYNIITASGLSFGFAHIVGNGTSETARSNAHTLDWQGNAWFAGDIYVGSTSGTNKDSGSKKVATTDDILTYTVVSTW